MLSNQSSKFNNEAMNAVHYEVSEVATYAVEQNFVKQQEEDEEQRKEITNYTNFIDKFKQIGWLDPFAEPTAKKAAKDQKTVKSVNFKKDLYPEYKMRDPEISPTIIYIPIPELMQKMIKACIGAKNPFEVMEKF